MSAILEHRSFRDFDWLLAALAIAIVCFGAWEIHNAQPTEAYWQKQLMGLGVALVAMLAIAFTDYRKLVEWAPAFYAFGLLLLVIVLIPGIGVRVHGQQCWIKLPILGQFQPSEFVKIPVVLMLAKYFGKHRQGALSWKEVIIGVGILALPMGLIMLEPDMGQCLTYLPLLAIVLFLSSIRMWIVVAVLAFSIVAAPASYVIGVKTGLLHGYKLERVNVILDPEKADKRGFGYHTWQSMVTVGEGGLTGTKASSEYSQSRLKFLPEPHTDFIFAVTAETTGFLGCILLLAAYAMLLLRLVTDARRSRDHTVGFVKIEDGADVRVIEGGSEPRFTFEAFEIGFLDSQLSRQNFYNYGAAEFVIGSFVDSALSAGADFLRDFVVAESLPDHEWAYLTPNQRRLQQGRGNYRRTIRRYSFSSVIRLH